MPRNISISSGTDFSKKIFGSVSKLRKPAFVHDGKIFSDNTFNNQRTIPLLVDNIYYTEHGLSDELIGYDYNNPISIINNTILNSMNSNEYETYSQFAILSDNTGSSVSERNMGATIGAMSTVGFSLIGSDDNYQCDVNNIIP
jgi:hypothetical protein